MGTLSLDNYVSPELLVILGIITLIALLLADMFDCTRLWRSYGNPICTYTYNDINGPSTWKTIFPNSTGFLQSPINIVSYCSMVVLSETIPPLRFSSEYHLPPKDLKAYNDGHCVSIYARWPNDARPIICGGPLCHPYQFFNARFRWGPNDDEGSEHTIDCHRYTMELQVLHVKTHKKYTDLNQAVEDNALLIITYFFQAGPIDNLYLQPLITALMNIQRPFTSTSLEPAPLSCLFPPFFCKYFMYTGSLTFPPCTEGVKWIVQPEPLGISSNQMNSFRKLCAVDGPMHSNTRPIEEINCREVFFYE